MELWHIFLLTLVGIAAGFLNVVAGCGSLFTLPVMVFALSYVFLANRDFWGWPVWASALGAAAYIPYSAALTPVFGALPFFDTRAMLAALHGVERYPVTIWEKPSLRLH